MSNYISKQFYFLMALLGLFSSGCPFAPVPEAYGLIAFISNEASVPVTIYTYDAPDLPPLDSAFIAPNEIRGICFFVTDSYLNLLGCEVGALKFVFANGKGYYCAKGNDATITSPESCFLLGKNPYLAERQPSDGSNTLFVITQEDFENAYEL